LSGILVTQMLHIFALDIQKTHGWTAFFANG